MFIRWIAVALALSATFPRAAAAQSNESGSWHTMQDAVVYGLFNHQGGPRGGDEVRVPNWWMGMFTRKVGSSDLTINTMLSLDVLTIGKKGYRELFQVGEAFEGEPLVDYQHPHDLFMQLAAVWRIPIGTNSGFTIAGGPSAEPALGPVAFMHRASAAENPLAPLSHHTFDSTHIAFGVVTVAFDRGPWTIEASMFNGHEPDEDRWNFDFGALDSFSGRLWFRPRDEWEFQILIGPTERPGRARSRRYRADDSLGVVADTERRGLQSGHCGVRRQQRRRRQPRIVPIGSDEAGRPLFNVWSSRVCRSGNGRAPCGPVARS